MQPGEGWRNPDSSRHPIAAARDNHTSDGGDEHEAGDHRGERLAGAAIIIAASDCLARSAEITADAGQVPGEFSRVRAHDGCDAGAVHLFPGPHRQ